jgi:hypothetical protein
MKVIGTLSDFEQSQSEIKPKTTDDRKPKPKTTDDRKTKRIGCTSK